MEEIWGFVGKKQKNATQEARREGMGDVWPVEKLMESVK